MSMLASAVTWSLGLWRLASGRIRADWRFLAGVWLLLACATTLLASGIIYGEAVTLGSLRATIHGAPVADQGVVVSTTLRPADVARVDDPVRQALGSALAGIGSTTSRLRSSSLIPIGSGPASGSRSLTLLESVDDIGAHARIADGRWPAAGRKPLEAALSVPASRALGLGVGATVRLADAATPGASQSVALVTVVIVGTYEPRVDDATWGGDALDLNGSAEVNGGPYVGPFLVDRADLLVAPFAALTVLWRAVPDVARLQADAIDPLRTRLANLPDSVRAVFPPRTSVDVTAGLGSLLDSTSHALQVARAAVLVLTLQYAVVAAYAVLLVAGMLADRRRPEVGLLRSRGASTGHIVALAFGEALLLAIPAGIVAPLAAGALVRLVGRVGPLGATGAVAETTTSPLAVVAIAVTVLVAAIVLTLPAFGAGAEVAGIRALLGRPMSRTLAQRLGVDVALLAVAGVAVWQLRSYGAPISRDARGALGLDPLLVAAPAFGLVAGGVLATRLIPRLGEVGERVLAGARGLVSPMAARQIARRPLRYTRAALLLMLATALGTFGAVYATTWTGSHADQASYQAGSDIRVTPVTSGALPEWALGTAYRAVPGVVGAVSVGRRDFAIGTVVRSGVIVAPDTPRAGGVIGLPPGSDSAGLPAGLAALAAARPEIAGVVLPEGTRRVRIRLDAALTEASIDLGQSVLEVPPDYRGITAAVVVRDADGGLERFSSATSQEAALFVGPGQTLIVPLDVGATGIAGAGIPGPGGPAEPRSVVGIEFALANPFEFYANPITGSLQLTGLETSRTVDRADWTTTDASRTSTWQWKESDAAGNETTVGSGAQPASLTTAGEFATEGLTPVRFVPTVDAANAIAAVAGDRLLAVTGSSVGQTLQGRSASSALNLKIVGRTAEFPTVDPGTPFAVIDGPTLALQRYLADRSLPGPTEWWLKVRPGTAGTVATTVASSPFRAQAVVNREAILASLESDPVGLGTLGALVLGSLAAAAFAVVGFLVGASVAMRERLGEFALLRALGLSSGQLSRWMIAEQAFLLGVGVGAGMGVGLLLAWLIVPATLLGSSGAPLVPAPILIVPWSALALVYLGALGLLVLASLVVGRPIPGRSLASLLRAAEE